MSKIKVGDRVRVMAQRSTDFSGVGQVTDIDGNWLYVSPTETANASWDDAFPFEMSRVTPEAAPGSAQSFHLFEVLLDASEEAHPSSKLFYNELIEAGLLHAQKQRDYGKPGDPFANVRSSEEWGIAPWVGAMVRLNDKVKRLQQLARTGGLANESAIDSFRDIAVYALIALVLYGQEGVSA